LGNLQVFLGPSVFNEYAANLKSITALLWGVRVLLLVTAIAHIVTAFKLARRASRARSKRRRPSEDSAATYASKTMMLSGPLLLFFLAYHIAHFTFPGVAFASYTHSTHDVYANVVNGFSVPWVSSLYIAAQLTLGVHLYHGAWSLFQSLGFNHPRYTPRVKGIAQTLAMALVAANITIPLGVVFGVIQ
jgi:succinate dehydrogenase / fumarate reductase cytochrome b subunit